MSLFHEVVASDKLPGKREDVAALARTEVVPEPVSYTHLQHLRVHGGNIPQRQYVRVPWTLPRTEQERTEGLYRLPIERG